MHCHTPTVEWHQVFHCNHSRSVANGSYHQPISQSYCLVMSLCNRFMERKKRDMVKLESIEHIFESFIKDQTAPPC